MTSNSRKCSIYKQKYRINKKLFQEFTLVLSDETLQQCILLLSSNISPKELSSFFGFLNRLLFLDNIL